MCDDGTSSGDASEISKFPAFGGGTCNCYDVALVCIFNCIQYVLAVTAPTDGDKNVVRGCPVLELLHKNPNRNSRRWRRQSP